MTTMRTGTGLAALYRASASRVDVLDVPPLHVLGVDGSGAPADPSFGRIVTSLAGRGEGPRT